MRSLGFLISRRWALFAVAVVLSAYAAWWLGEWQFGRLDQRRHDNAVIRANEGAAAVPATDVLAPGRAVTEDDEWRLVTATGTYAVDDTVIVRYRTREGEAGVDVVVPLTLADGTSLLVDRGWMPTENTAAGQVEPPAPPAGEVTVEAWVRADATGASTRVADRSTRAISSRTIGPALGRPVLGGFTELKSEDPPAADALMPVELPDLGEGPHFFYGLQWWFFGVLAVFGFGYLAYDEWRGRRRPDDDPGGESDDVAASPRAVPAGAPRRARITLRDRLDKLTAPDDED